MSSESLRRTARVAGVCWEGLDLPAATEDEKASFFLSYDRGRLQEAVDSNLGVVRGTRYELAVPDARGDLGPSFLVVYEIVNVEALVGCTKALADSAAALDLSSKPLSRDPLPPVVRWRMAFACLGRQPQQGAEPLPYLQAIGMDLPPTTDTELIKGFNSFYSQTHVPEVLSAFNFERGHRYELVAGFAAPSALHRRRDDGASNPVGLPPRYLATYEGRMPIDIQEDNSDYPWSEGPAVWQARRTRWRLLYKRAWSYAGGKADG